MESLLQCFSDSLAFAELADSLELERLRLIVEESLPVLLFIRLFPVASLLVWTLINRFEVIGVELKPTEIIVV